MDVIKISDGKINAPILESDELVTEFTVPAEQHTECLTGIPINTNLSVMEANLCPVSCPETKWNYVIIRARIKSLTKKQS